MNRLTSTTVYLALDQAHDLAKASRKLGVSRSALIRKGIDMVIDWAEIRSRVLEKADALMEEEEEEKRK